MLFLSNSQFVREFYLLVWIKKDSSIKKKKKERKKDLWVLSLPGLEVC